jgi:hypothetical protein
MREPTRTTVARRETRVAAGERQTAGKTSVACVHDLTTVRLACALRARRQSGRVGVVQCRSVAGPN